MRSMRPSSSPASSRASLPGGLLEGLGPVAAAGHGLEAPRPRVLADVGAGAELLDHQDRAGARVEGKHGHRVAAGEDPAADDVRHGPVEAAVAEAVLLEAEVVRIGEVALDRLDVARPVGGAEHDGHRARPRPGPAERTDADAVEERRHLRGRPAAVVAHDLDERLDEAGAVLAGRDALPVRRRPGEDVSLGRRACAAGLDGEGAGRGAEGGHREVEAGAGLAGGGDERSLRGFPGRGGEGDGDAARVAPETVSGERGGPRRRKRRSSPRRGARVSGASKGGVRNRSRKGTYSENEA